MSWLSVNIGITKPFIKDISGYIGIGISISSVFRKYYDKYEMLGKHGSYWIEDNNASERKINIMTGIFYKIRDKYNIKFSIDTSPVGFGIGIGSIIK